MSSISTISSPLSRQSQNKKKRSSGGSSYIGMTTAGKLLLFVVVASLVYLFVAIKIYRAGGNDDVGGRTHHGKTSPLDTMTHKVVVGTHRDKGDDGEEDNFLPRVLALVFPQFHRDPLNDYLWGEGFTDWDNLRNAPAKNRLGYRIPRPTELGYYDYTDVEPRRRQGELANEYGIDGFLYHHYWFYDPDRPGPSLHAPLMKMLEDGHPDVPFAFHWCAIKWTNTWSGSRVSKDFVFKEDGILQKQYFPKEKDDPLIVEHYNWLRRFFHHENYIKVDGKPLLMMYQRKPGSMVVLRRFRELAVEDGFPGLYFTVGLNKNHEHLLRLVGEDESLVVGFERSVQRTFGFNLYDKVVSYPNPSDWGKGRSLEVPSWCNSKTTPANNTSDAANEKKDGGHGAPKNRLRDIVGIISSFDNTPRRNYEGANLFASDDKPDVILERFRKSLFAALYYESCCFGDADQRLRKKRKDDDRFILINAMNEWAEGMMLEPSDVYGRGYLEAIRDTKAAVKGKRCLS